VHFQVFETKMEIFGCPDVEKIPSKTDLKINRFLIKIIQTLEKNWTNKEKIVQESSPNYPTPSSW